MKIGHRWKPGTIAMLMGILLLVVGAAACSGGDNDAVDLLNDPKVGLAHLNEEMHTIKGEDLLANPKFGLAHLNDEFHTIKEMLAELSQQVKLLQSPDPVALYQDMGAEMESLTSFHTLVTVGDDEGSEQFEMDFLAPDRVRMTPVGEGWFAEALGIGGQFYLRMPGFQGWFVEDEESEVFNLSAFTSGLYTQASGLTYIGQETVEGVLVHHIQGTLRGDVLQIIDAGENDESAAADFWIGVYDSFLYRVRMEESSSGEVADMVFSASDVPVTIEVPSKTVSSEVWDGLERGDIAPDLLGDLISILPLEGQGCLREHLGETTYSDLVAGVGSMSLTEEAAFERCLPDFFG